MAILPIAIYPEPILKTVAEPVATVTDEIRVLLDNMTETMYAAPGVGLAGPQVHHNKRVLVCDVGEPVLMEQEDVDPDIQRTPKLYQLINPEILDSSGSLTWEEGCLSLPELHVEIERNEHIIVRALNRDGEECTIDAHGLLAVVLQHEIDHLNGTLIIDQLSNLKRNMYAKKLAKQLKEHV
jgi:peptide deformylase